ncbi:VOC family protein [Bosea caraganae]|uniref:VOC family protein n=1 Tax=Bosea caraganae TaxID=2763117 RepID=A0A370L6F1_9HYPH|nr:VOC family protein [Bosea caraganae]RDJ24205.1 VOC family protein [Bosea caraganae]RDJ30246.1 VOC family protein [Bosea caraganae]
MLQRDHLTVIAPSLAEGVAHVRSCLDLDIPYGRAHDGMGTHNHLLRLGDDVYLEVIAVDPAAPPPGRPRWFGLDDSGLVRSNWDEGFRLRGWVARTTGIADMLARHGAILGEEVRLTGSGRSFSFAVPPGGALPLAGLAPSVIDRGGYPPSIAAMPELGARLRSFTVEHPQPEDVAALYERLGVENPPDIRRGERLRYRAMIETPAGLRELN